MTRNTNANTKDTNTNTGTTDTGQKVRVTDDDITRISRTAVLNRMEPGTEYITASLSRKCNETEANIEVAAQILADNDDIEHRRTPDGYDVWKKPGTPATND